MEEQGKHVAAMQDLIGDVLAFVMKNEVDKKKEDAKAKLEEKAKGILEGADTYDKWTKEKLFTVLKYKEVPGVTIQMDKEALRTAYENTLPLA